MLRILRIFIGAACVIGAAAPLQADTVYLKNGSYIDGVVTARSERVIQVSIGRIGKLEIEVEKISHVEKNSRTGTTGQAPVVNRKLDLPGVKEKPDSAEDESSAKEAAASSDDSAQDEADPVDRQPGDAKQQSQSEDEAIDPELKKQIEAAVHDLQRQKAKHRWRAERQLREIGEPAIPFLIPVAKNGADLTRTIVYRFFAEHASGENDEVVEVCLAALDDETVYVRDYAVQALRKFAKKNLGFRPEAVPALRQHARDLWHAWWSKEKEKREKEASRSDDGASKKSSASNAVETDAVKSKTDSETTS